MKKKYIAPMIAVVKTDVESLLANTSPHDLKQAVRLVDKTTKSDMIKDTEISGSDNFLFGISDGGGTPNAKDNGWDLWEE